MLGWGNLFIGGLGNFPGHETYLAQARRSVEAQQAYALRTLGAQSTHPLSALLMANYRPPNPIPWEKRYADFCARLDRATSSHPPSV
jgi:hypothetical protein